MALTDFTSTPAPDTSAAPGLARAARGLAPLPLLTLVNFFNYLDRQVVYGMTPFIGESFGLSKFQLGLLAWINLVVFAMASLISGPIADRYGPRRVIFSGVLVWSLATMGSALATSFPMLLACRALVGVGEGAYGPSAIMLLCSAAPASQRGRALGIYNAGMAVGGSAGLFLGSALAPEIGWRGVFWIAGGPSLLLAALAGMVAAPSRLPRPRALPARSYILGKTFIVTALGGILVTFAASALLFWARWVIVDERGFSPLGGSIIMGVIGIVCGIGGVVVGGIAGDAVAKRRQGGHALVMGVSLVAAFPLGLGCLLLPGRVAFVALMIGSVFLLCMYNGPIGVVVDELGPPQYAATLQATFLFLCHVIGDASAPPIIGKVADFTSVSNSLLLAVGAYGIAACMFLWTYRRLQAAPPHA